ncbi:MAG: TolC family protein [Endomicrobium sp.]|jgi:outer membrane protein TolC|nr:TolC family protein [Endomicrobium sp.]
MKKIIYFSVLIFALCPGAVFGEGFEKILTQDSCIQSAIAIHPDILISAQNIEFANQRVLESRALYMPKIAVNLNLSKFNNTDPMVLSGDFTGMPVYLPAGIKNIYYSTRLSAWQGLYSGGRVKTINKLARINLDKVQNEAQSVKIKVVNNVKSAFNDALYNKEKLKLINSLAGKALSEAKSSKNKNSYSLHSELLKKAAAARYNYEKELLNLLNAVGLELNTIADISGEFQPEIKNIDLSRCIVLAYQFKPEMQATQYQESFDSLMLSLLSMQQYPTVSAGAAQEWTGDQIIGDASNWYVSLNVNIPVFDGGATFARVRQGKINVREAALKRSKTEDEVKLLINKAFLEYNFWKQQALQLPEEREKYGEADLDIIYNLNKSYYALELAVGAELNSY